MTLKELREIYERSSSRASEINRKLIFAGIAIVWLFHISTDNWQNTVPENFKPILAIFCIAMLTDVAQYVIGSLMWHFYYFIHRRGHRDEGSVKLNEPEWWNALPDSLWFSKFVFTGIGYYQLAVLLLPSILSVNRVMIFTSFRDCRFLFFTWVSILMVWLLWYAGVHLIKNLFRNNSSRIKQTLRTFKQTLKFVSKIYVSALLFFVLLVMVVLVLRRTMNQLKVYPVDNEQSCVINPSQSEIMPDTITIQNAIKTNQEAIIKLLQPKPEVKNAATSKKTAKKNSSKVKKQPLYLPLDTINCDGKEYMIVEKVK